MTGFSPGADGPNHRFSTQGLAPVTVAEIRDKHPSRFPKTVTDTNRGVSRITASDATARSLNELEPAAPKAAIATEADAPKSERYTNKTCYLDIILEIPMDTLQLAKVTRHPLLTYM